ncbi:hypothetical protein KPSA1_03519 [Pseudomonas syringae pv. actinidiae]|uniref:Uncharacterized protein n=1 Tax=Pseudomonas syringae pv. actinidiae TaxID=103796 RepID=A0A2V0QAV5_PSESF|nr:hypothetical protein KPSA1_03519 [Pseudomonas syringae pv. actinidiae]
MCHLCMTRMSLHLQLYASARLSAVLRDLQPMPVSLHKQSSSPLFVSSSVLDFWCSGCLYCQAYTLRQNF